MSLRYLGGRLSTSSVSPDVSSNQLWSRYDHNRFTSVNKWPQVLGECLLVAGGGGGGGYGSAVTGGGGGAGGVLLQKFPVIKEITYTVIIGAGGAGSAVLNAAGSPGNNTVLKYSNTTLTAIGGGRGVIFPGNSNMNGGSGGGCSGNTGATHFGSAGYSVTGQGSWGSLGSGNLGGGPCSGGGGGGASGPGTNTVGGAGLSSNISGTPTIYSIGGSATGGVPASGAANTGNGGGGHAGSGASGNGGSGILILKVPFAAATTTGSPSISTVGTDTIYIFNGSGSITF